MGSKRDVPPPPIVDQVVDGHGLNAALRLFVAAFVVDDKRTQVHKRLLTAVRRLETLTTLPRWLAGRTSTLDGADRSPAGLQARFGDLSGVHLDDSGARRVTIARALQVSRSRASLFIGDSGRIAMVTAADAPPTLCSPA